MKEYFEDAFKDAMKGIKKKRLVKKITPFDPDDGTYLDVQEGKEYVPGHGLVHYQEIHEKVFNCGHSAGIGLGHICNSGHSVCVACVERHVFECGCGCHKKLCTCIGCDYYAIPYYDVFYYEPHLRRVIRWDTLGWFFGCGTRIEQERSDEAKKYYDRRLQLRGPLRPQLPRPGDSQERSR